MNTITVDNIRLILFDLDGTLIDSVGDLAWCCNEMLKQLGRPQHSTEKVATWVGNGVERLVKRALTEDMEAEPDAVLFDQAMPIFNELYAGNVSEYSRVYPGVIEGLQQLQQTSARLACVTNKAERFTLPLLKGLGLLQFFELVVSGDTTAKKKPDPMQLNHAAEFFGFDNIDCLMVGDSSNDIKAARAAGFQVVAVPYGYNHGIDIRESNPDLVIDSFVELAALFEKSAA